MSKQIHSTSEQWGYFYSLVLVLALIDCWQKKGCQGEGTRPAFWADEDQEKDEAAASLV